MYITETKLLIDEIDTPILKTNGLFVKGRALHKALFQGEYYTIKTDVVEELIKNGATNTSSGGAEQILGFSMTVYPQFDNMPLESVTLRRLDTNGNANCLSTALYMYVDCFVGDELVKTIYSDNNAQQVEGDNLQTTWNFVNSDFRLSQSFSRVQFRFTQQKGNRQNKTARSSYMGSSSNKLYIEGWKTMYPNQSAGNEWKPFSTNFYIRLTKGFSGIQQHIDNDVIHFTQENRQQLNNQYEELNTAFENHVADDDIHVTAQEKQKINSITSDLGDLNDSLINLINDHKTQEGLHWTVDDRESILSMNSSISTVSNDLKRHKADMNLHWSESDKMKINECIEHIPNINQKFEDIHSEIENTLQTSYTTLREGLELIAGGRMATKAIQLSRAHFTDGKIKEIHIPYYNYSQTDSGKTANLCVQIFYAGQNEQTIKPDSECFWSTDVITQDKHGTSFPNDAGVSIFRFDNLEIPRDYSFVRLCFVSDIGQNPNGTNNCVDYRIQVLSSTGTNSGYTGFDDDLCKLLPSGGNYYAYVNVIKANKLEEITDFQTKFDYFSNHVSETRIHVSPEDRTKWDNLVERVAALEARISELENS